MKIAFTYNLRLTDVRETEKEAEYDSADTVNAIATALEVAGHEVEKVEVSGPATNLLERLEAIDPDIIFNTAEGEKVVSVERISEPQGEEDVETDVAGDGAPDTDAPGPAEE